MRSCVLVFVAVIVSLIAELCALLERNCFFFFQAEDGIRDSSVTGVQTCALPISGSKTAKDSGRAKQPRNCPSSSTTETLRCSTGGLPPEAMWTLASLSIVPPPKGEIGRACVGKECRSRWSPYH